MSGTSTSWVSSADTRSARGGSGPRATQLRWSPTWFRQQQWLIPSGTRRFQKVGGQILPAHFSDGRDAVTAGVVKLDAERCLHPLVLDLARWGHDVQLPPYARTKVNRPVGATGQPVAPLPCRGH